MAIWQYSGKEVSEEDLGKAHSDDCLIHKLVVEIQSLKGSKEG